jgi:hypothetical protein
MKYSKWEWIVTAIDAIERCGKARRLFYSALFLLALGWAFPNFIDAVSRL